MGTKKATSLRSGFWRFYRYRMISNRRLSAGVDQVSVMGEEPGAPEESAQSDVEIAGAEQGEEWDRGIGTEGDGVDNAPNEIDAHCRFDPRLPIEFEAVFDVFETLARFRDAVFWRANKSRLIADECFDDGAAIVDAQADSEAHDDGEIGQTLHEGLLACFFLRQEIEHHDRDRGAYKDDGIDPNTRHPRIFDAEFDG